MDNCFDLECSEQNSNHFHEFLNSRKEKMKWYHLTSLKLINNKDYCIKRDMYHLTKALSTLDIIFVHKLSIDIDLISFENNFFEAYINKAIKTNRNIDKLCIHLNCSQCDYKLSEHVINILIKLHINGVYFAIDFDTVGGLSFWKLLNSEIISYINLKFLSENHSLSQSIVIKEILEQFKLKHIETILSHSDIDNSKQLTLTQNDLEFDYYRSNVIKRSNF